MSQCELDQEINKDGKNRLEKSDRENIFKLPTFNSINFNQPVNLYNNQQSS